ncbi:Cytoplasmic protein nck2 [Desmophyllum pertusum]|uniref:Cytoplasmic protein nck2 n=1 Tax=Desmophyllum pertusum TaxID=174260 RepID=A0A9X0CV62_9CNID|nr:Cytoplasmic protein nck2 [Desmophyllum pertusum]
MKRRSVPLRKKKQRSVSMETQILIVAQKALKIQVRMSPYEEGEEEEEEEFSTEMYCAIETYEVDDEMHLSKGDYVEVLERASAGWWLVQNEDGLKGWAPSNYLCPAPQVNGNTECLVPDEEVRLINKEVCDR